MNTNLHPVNTINRILIYYFAEKGFKLKQFNEIRTVTEEFVSTGIVENNPVRDFGRTFYIDKEHVLQAHMTAIRETVKQEGKGMYIIPGRIYRVNQEKNIRNIIFHQIEGYITGMNMNLYDMNDLINNAYYRVGLLKKNLLHTTDFTKFTSPTIQYYYKCHVCGGNGCDVCGHKGTICFAAGGIESETWKENDRECNISFCISVDRLAMVKFGYHDMRKMYEG